MVALKHLKAPSYQVSTVESSIKSGSARVASFAPLHRSSDLSGNSSFTIQRWISLGVGSLLGYAAATAFHIRPFLQSKFRHPICSYLQATENIRVGHPSAETLPCVCITLFYLFAYLKLSHERYGLGTASVDNISRPSALSFKRFEMTRPHHPKLDCGYI